MSTGSNYWFRGSVLILRDVTVCKRALVSYKLFISIWYALRREAVHRISRLVGGRACFCFHFVLAPCHTLLVLLNASLSLPLVSFFAHFSFAAVALHPYWLSEFDLDLDIALLTTEDSSRYLMLPSAS